MSKALRPELDTLAASLRGLAEQMKRSRAIHEKDLPTTDPDAYFHALDCNLHTMVGARFVRDEVQILELKDETRVQFLAAQPELCFFIDVPKKKGRVRFLFLDGSRKQKESATYRDVTETVHALDERQAAVRARLDADAQPRERVAAVARTSTLPPSKKDAPCTAEEVRTILGRIAAAAKTARSTIDVSIGPRSKLRLRLRDGDIELDATAVQKALRVELGNDNDLGVVRLLRATVAPQELDELVAPMAAHFLDAEEKRAASRWLLSAAAALGDEKTAAILGRHAWMRRADSKAHAVLSAIVEALGQMGTPRAAHEIYGIALMPSRYTKRRNEAKAVFERIAGRAGVSVDELVAIAVPREVPEEDRARILEVQGRRLERLMVDGKRWTLAQLCSLLFAQPLLRPICEQLVFGVFDSGTGVLSASFQPDGDKLLDAQGSERRIADSAQVGIAHPVELEAAGVLADWRKKVRAQPFFQLERPIHTLSERQKKTNVIYDYKSYRRDFLHEQEWWGYKVDSDYMSDVDTFAVRMERDGKYLEAKLDGQGRIFAIGMGKVALDYDLLRKDYRATPDDATLFGALHPVSQSELLYALLGSLAPMVTRPAASASRRAASASRYPYVERAKSSRSQCLFCDAKIEKDSVRVVIEREISSDAFTGTGPGYLHPSCARRHESCAGIADLDAVLRENSPIPWPDEEEPR